MEDTSTDTGVNLRIYRPVDTAVLPAVVFFHGGGFNSGGMVSHDRHCRQLANLSGVVVIAVDYRLAPEHPFPCGLNDCVDATGWVMHNAGRLSIDPDLVGECGDSAGGTLVAGVAKRVPGLVCQVLIYPAMDPALGTGSWREFANGPVITLETMKKVWRIMQGGVCRRRWYVRRICLAGRMRL